MLGKGLESLIPKKGGQNFQQHSGNTGALSQPVFLPVGDIIDDAERELPAPYEVKEVIAQKDESFLPLASQQVMHQVANDRFDIPEISEKIETINKPVIPETSHGTIISENHKTASFPEEERLASIFSIATDPKLKKKEEQEYIFHIEVDKVSPNPGQPRRHFDETALRDLANSIREFGFIQPIVVTKKEIETSIGIDVSYELIAGERRLLAAKLLGLLSVPAIIRKVDLEREKVELAVIENIQREQLNPIETARAFQRLQEEFRMTQREIAAKLGKSRETVANSVRLLDLPEYIQEALQKGEISESHGRFLLAINDPAAQKKLFEDISLKGLTTRDVRERVRQITKKAPAGSVGEDLTPEFKEMQDHLSATLGAPVEIHQNAGNGKITITFYSEEELGNILRRLGTEG